MLKMFSPSTRFFRIFFGPWKHEKKQPQKLLIIGQNFVFQHFQPAQIQPKFQFLFHKNLPPRDFSIMTLVGTSLASNSAKIWVGWRSLSIPPPLIPPALQRIVKVVCLCLPADSFWLLSIYFDAFHVFAYKSRGNEENPPTWNPSLNTQSCIRELLVVRGFCFWAV